MEYAVKKEYVAKKGFNFVFDVLYKLTKIIVNINIKHCFLSWLLSTFLLVLNGFLDIRSFKG